MFKIIVYCYYGILTALRKMFHIQYLLDLRCQIFNSLSWPKKKIDVILYDKQNNMKLYQIFIYNVLFKGH